MKDTDKLEALLRSLNLKSFLRNYKDFAEKSHKQKLTHIAYLYELVQGGKHGATNEEGRETNQ